MAVHQTLGRPAAGWADNFGGGLPTVTISGHTGWRGAAGGPDGMTAFQNLNKLIHTDYHAEKQKAIDGGIDPASVQLILVDMLDNLILSVAPVTFVLRRSRSRPLLFQYNISLQGISSKIDMAMVNDPVSALIGSPMSLLDALSKLQGAFEAISKFIKDVMHKALFYINSALSPFLYAISEFHTLTHKLLGFVGLAKNIFGSALDAASTFPLVDRYSGSMGGSGGTGGGSGGAGAGTGSAGGTTGPGTSSIQAEAELVAQTVQCLQAGENLFRVIGAHRAIPQDLAVEIMDMASAYHEGLCIIRKSIVPDEYYEQFEPLYGASNCSSTGGGRPASPLRDTNPFALLEEGAPYVRFSSDAAAALSLMGGADVLLNPPPIERMLDYTDRVVAGVEVLR